MFWNRQPDGRVMVYYYDADAQLQKSVPRHKTKHLDHEPDDVIEQWSNDTRPYPGSLRPDLTLSLSMPMLCDSSIGFAPT
jgi:hypothetical protein